MINKKHKKSKKLKNSLGFYGNFEFNIYMK